MKTYLSRLTHVACLLWLLSALPANATTYTVTSSPYNADNTGHTDATSAIQHAINDAIAAGSGNTVSLPAGTYLVATGGLSIQHSTNLTFTGHTASDTTLLYSRAQAHGFSIWYNTNFTIENFTADVGKDPGGSGNYDLGIAQGTVTGWSRTANTITVNREAGYPLLTRSDIAGSGSIQNINNGYSNVVWLRDDPTRIDFTGANPGLKSVQPAPDGNSATLTLDQVPSDIHVGEVYDIYTTAGGLWMDCGYGNSGTTSIQYINYYGGAVNWMGNFACPDPNGTCLFDHLYCGPPPYQNDRGITCCEGWQGGSRGKTIISNSTLLRTWDDVWDIGDGTILTSAQGPGTNQVTLNGNFGTVVGDSVEFIDDTDQPTGTVYASATVTARTVTNGKEVLTLNSSVTLRNPTKDLFSDISAEGTITATNDTFNNATGRHVYLRSLVGIDVENCTFQNGTLLQTTGWDNSQGPTECRNVTVNGCTFQKAAGISVVPDFGNWTAASCSNVKITNNKFLGPVSNVQINLWNTTGATIANNWFDNDTVSNIDLNYDANVALKNNTFLHPNETKGSSASDSSVVYIKNVAGLNLSGNMVYSAGPYTNSLALDGGGNSSVNGLANGIIDIDNPIAFYLSYDTQVMDRPTTGSILDQAAWTGGSNQKWQLLPNYSSPGTFTMNDSGNGKYVGNGTSITAGANIVEENQAWTTSTSQVPTAEQLWSLAYIDNNTSNIIDSYSGYDINVNGGSSSPGTQLIQYYAGSSQNQNFETVTPPYLVQNSQLGLVNLNWTPVPYATSYSLGRSATAGGPYATIASGLATATYTDSALPINTPYYYQVTAAGLPLTYGKSNETFSIATGSYVPVNISSAFDITGIEPNGWVYNGYGYDNWQSTYSGNLVGKYITANSCQFSTAPAGVPDVVADQGQRIALPSGFYSSLQMLGAYVGGSNGQATGTFQPTLTYIDGTQVVLSQGMTNWCGPHSQAGETDAATYTSRNLANGTSQSVTNYIHAYSIPIDSTRQPAVIDLPSTGNFRILAMDLAGENNTFIPVGGSLQQGQYISSPSGTCYLTQQSDGNLVLYNGSGPANKGAAIWGSVYGSTDSYYTIMQSDGNLVTYHGTPQNPGPYWWGSGTYGDTVTALRVTDSKEIQIVNGTTVVWQKP